MGDRESALVDILRPMFFDGDKLNGETLGSLEALLAEKGYEITGQQGAQITVEKKAADDEGSSAPPSAPSLTLDESFKFGKKTHWNLVQRTKGRDAFQFYDSTGASQYFTKGKFFAIGKDVTVFSMKQEPLFKVKQAWLNLRNTFQIKDAEGETLATVQRKIFHTSTPFRPYYKVTRGSDEDDLLYKISGNLGGYIFDVTNADDQPVATIREKVSVQSMADAKKNSYEIVVQPGIDCLMMSFIGLICDCIDNE